MGSWVQRSFFFYNIPSLAYVTEFQHMSNPTLVTLFPSSKRFPRYFRSITIFIIHHRQLRREPQMYRLSPEPPQSLRGHTMNSNKKLSNYGTIQRSLLARTLVMIMRQDYNI